MKNIQIVDNAINCSLSIYQINNEDFYLIFPQENQNIEFIEDFISRIGDVRAAKILKPVWRSRIEKKDVSGLHGTLFYGLAFKKEFYPNKKESDLD